MGKDSKNYQPKLIMRATQYYGFLSHHQQIQRTMQLLCQQQSRFFARKVATPIRKSIRQEQTQQSPPEQQKQEQSSKKSDNVYERARKEASHQQVQEEKQQMPQEQRQPIKLPRSEQFQRKRGRSTRNNDLTEDEEYFRELRGKSSNYQRPQKGKSDHGFEWQQHKQYQPRDNNYENEDKPQKYEKPWQQKLKQGSKLKDNMTKTMKEFEEIKKKVILQSSEGTLDEISLLEYTQYLKNKEVLGYPTILIMLLNQFYKKLLRTEGIANINEEDDDIFRPVHAESRRMVSSMINSRQEVINAVRMVFDQLKSVKIDKQATFFTFLVKSGYQFNEKELEQIAQNFKVASVQAMQSQLLLSSVAIFSKMAAKLVLSEGKSGYEHFTKTKEIMSDLCKYTILPICEKHYKIMSVAEASMILRSLQAVMSFNNPSLPNRILKHQLTNLQRASNMELYGFLDLALDINISVIAQGTGLFEKEPLFIVSTLLEELTSRMKDKEKYQMKEHEVAGFLKIISNKKLILPYSQLSAVTNDFLTLSQEYAASLDKIEMNNLVHFMNTYQRYDFPATLSEGFTKLTNTCIDEFIKQQQQTSFVSNMELYRLIVSCLHYSKQITVPRCSEVIKLFLAREQYINKESERIPYLKCVSSIIGRLHKKHLRLDDETYKKLRELAQFESHVQQSISNDKGGERRSKHREKEQNQAEDKQQVQEDISRRRKFVKNDYDQFTKW